MKAEHRANPIILDPATGWMSCSREERWRSGDGRESRTMVPCIKADADGDVVAPVTPRYAKRPGISLPSGLGWLAQWPLRSMPRQTTECAFQPLNARTSEAR